MMLIQGNDQDIMQQRRECRGKICFNIIEGTCQVLRAAKYRYSTEVEPEFQKFAEIALDAENLFLRIQKDPGSSHLQVTGLVEAITSLYTRSNTFRTVLRKRHEYSLFDNWKYFVRKLADYPEFGGPDWIPSQDDLLHSRIMTTGLKEVSFRSQDLLYNMIDVGGQRAERKKFLFLFADMDCLLFVGSMSDYDENLYEDEEVNRLSETFQVFRETAKRPEFKDTWIILFLNKFDLFKKKYIEYRVPIGDIEGAKYAAPKIEDEDPELNQGCELAKKWFKDSFTDLVPEEKRSQMKIYYTSALLPSNNIQEVMEYSVNMIQNQVVA